MAHSFVLALMILALVGCSGLSGEPAIVATVARPMATAVASASNWQADIENGARIFAERCVGCHGAAGDGMGELALAGSISQPRDMSERAWVELVSPLDYFQVITEGRLDKLMPPWQDALSERERWDVALYSYSLSYGAALLEAGEAIWLQRCGGCEAPTAIPPRLSDADYGARLNGAFFLGELTAAEAGSVAAYLRMRTLAANMAQVELGSVSGRVKQGTAGSQTPGDTIVQLQYGNAEMGVSRAETQVDAALTFRFDAIPIRDDFRYVVSAVYQGRLFSLPLPALPADDVEITLYDLTDDAGALSISRIELVIDAVKLADLGAGLYISQGISLRNESDRIFSSDRRFDDGREAVLLLRFPRGALIMSGDANGRYVVIEDMPNIPNAIIDTLPVPPGEGHQVVMEYFLSYAENATIEQEFNYAMDAELSVTLAAGLSVSGEAAQLNDKGALAADYRRFSGRLQQDREPRLKLEITGDPFAVAGSEQAIVAGEHVLVLLAVAGGAMALLTGLRYRRRRGGEIERLVAQLARLDEDHDQGRINHDLWHQRRRELKARLAELMAADSQAA